MSPAEPDESPVDEAAAAGVGCCGVGVTAASAVVLSSVENLLRTWVGIHLRVLEIDCDQCLKIASSRLVNVSAHVCNFASGTMSFGRALVKASLMAELGKFHVGLSVYECSRMYWLRGVSNSSCCASLSADMFLSLV